MINIMSNTLIEIIIFTNRQRSCGKVMFLQASVSLFKGGGGGGSPPDHTPRTISPPPGWTSGRYASYWNGFLLSVNQVHEWLCSVGHRIENLDLRLDLNLTTSVIFPAPYAINFIRNAPITLSREF